MWLRGRKIDGDTSPVLRAWYCEKWFRFPVPLAQLLGPQGNWQQGSRWEPPLRTLPPLLPGYVFPWGYMVATWEAYVYLLFSWSWPHHELPPDKISTPSHPQL